MRTSINPLVCQYMPRITGRLSSWTGPTPFSPHSLPQSDSHPLLRSLVPFLKMLPQYAFVSTRSLLSSSSSSSPLALALERAPPLHSSAALLSFLSPFTSLSHTRAVGLVGAWVLSPRLWMLTAHNPILPLQAPPGSGDAHPPLH